MGSFLLFAKTGGDTRKGKKCWEAKKKKGEKRQGKKKVGTGVEKGS